MIDFQNVIITITSTRKPSTDLSDYKFFCFQGKPLYCQLITDRSTSEKIDWYDMDWNLIEGLQGLTSGIPNSGKLFPKPVSFEIMKNMTKKISSAINSPFVRIDFYEINNCPYFGEITFYPASGFGQFHPKKHNILMGMKITL